VRAARPAGKVATLSYTACSRLVPSPAGAGVGTIRSTRSALLVHWANEITWMMRSRRTPSIGRTRPDSCFKSRSEMLPEVSASTVTDMLARRISPGSQAANISVQRHVSCPAGNSAANVSSGPSARGALSVGTASMDVLGASHTPALPRRQGTRADAFNSANKYCEACSRRIDVQKE